MKFLPAFCLLFLPLLNVVAGPIAYSGKVAVNGTNLDGSAQFKFSLVDHNGTTLWRHSDDENASVAVDVRRGHYSILLGEGMNPIPNDLFLSNPVVYLQVRLNVGGGNFLHLQPDQRIVSAAHALSAAIADSAKVADSVKPGAVTRAGLSADVLADLNRSITRSDLPADVLADLNATINRSRLAADVLADLNRSIAAGSVTRGMLAAGVQADLNASLSAASVTAANIHPDLVKYFLPEISSHPAGVAVLKGTGATLSSSATGKFLTFQWKKNGVNLSGENNATLVFTDANASLHDGNYSVLVGNDWGNVASNVATFTVATNPPVIILEGNASVTHEGGVAYVDSGATASDALNGNLTVAVVVTGSVDVNETGQNQIKYNVTDTGGNAAAEKVRTVTVVDTTPPVISLIGDSNLTHALNTAWNDPGVTAADTLDGNLSTQVAVAGVVDVNQTGSTVLTYSVSDAAGNAATPVTRTVNVIEPPSGPWTFRRAGASGRFGPTQAQADANYSGTTLAGKVTIDTQGIQEWTVPTTGTYRIEAWGAAGGAGTVTAGGLGARMASDYQLVQGSVIKILVGQKGMDGDKAGGGGGTFVARTNNTPLVVAGGGGGGARSCCGSSLPGGAGLTSTSGGNGQNSSNSNGDGGSNGGGGLRNNGSDSNGGAGFTGNGSNEAKSFVNGGQGDIQGGFGGGAGTSNGAGGGAGGYSGGGASGGGDQWGAGGGGSYNSGTNQSNTAGANEGHGKVTITFVLN